jgi:membrane protein implicated in regulation of membrane protease activity
MLSTLLAVVLALVIATVLAFCLPVWASLSIALAAVLTVSIGGGALLAKAFVAASIVAVVVWLWRRHQRRQLLEQTDANVRLLAIPEAKTKGPQAGQRRTERQAA